MLKKINIVICESCHFNERAAEIMLSIIIEIMLSIPLQARLVDNIGHCWEQNSVNCSTKRWLLKALTILCS